jgi:hypothetical protein
MKGIRRIVGFVRLIIWGGMLPFNLCRRRNVLMFFAFDGDCDPSDAAPSCNYTVSRCFEECSVALKTVGFAETKARERFRDGAEFCWLRQREVGIVSWGWLQVAPASFYISEIGITLIECNNTILFDFETNVTQRRKGYYRMLLGEVVADSSRPPYLIYADSRNFASIRGIRSADFRFRPAICVLLNAGVTTSRG